MGYLYIHQAQGVRVAEQYSFQGLHPLPLPLWLTLVSAHLCSPREE